MWFHDGCSRDSCSPATFAPEIQIKTKTHPVSLLPSSSHHPLIICSSLLVLGIWLTITANITIQLFVTPLNFTFLTTLMFCNHSKWILFILNMKNRFFALSLSICVWNIACLLIYYFVDSHQSFVSNLSCSFCRPNPSTHFSLFTTKCVYFLGYTFNLSYTKDKRNTHPFNIVEEAPDENIL